MKTFRQFVEESLLNPLPSGDSSKKAQKAPQQPVMEFVEPDPRSSYAEKLQQARVAAAERRNAALNAAKERSEAINQQREEEARERKIQALQDKLNQLQR